MTGVSAMELENWWPWYKRIEELFGYSAAEDQRAADVLSRIAPPRTVTEDEVRRMLEGRAAIVFGCGPSLDRNIAEIVGAGLQRRYRLLAADGATTALLRNALLPSLVTSDLDGRLGDIKTTNDRGSIVAIHAHGDNIESLKRHTASFRGRVLCTTQVAPRRAVYNFGGFTDGDRCVFIAEHVGATRLALAGMDFGEVVGKYSKPGHESHYQASPPKAKKLRLAKRLIGWLANRTETEILNVTGIATMIPGVSNVEYTSL
jgi:uncharacterized Rossmann fold enzyme